MKQRIFEERDSAPRNAYKHNAFLMNLGVFLRKVLQNHQETTGFIRVPRLHFAVSGNARFPQEYEGFSRPRRGITECL